VGERLSCLQAVRSIQTDPYPHACVEQALPDPLYEELEATFPEHWMLDGFSCLISRLSPTEQSRQRVWRRMRRLMGMWG
jgi:hypothetical protein